MKAFFCRLIPPRPSFAEDMSEAEAQLMEEHARYWRDWMAKGRVVAFGLVGDPAGPYGIGIVEVEDEAQLRSFTENDPTIRSGRGFRFEVHQMPFGVVHR
jgi:hypothetical protein